MKKFEIVAEMTKEFFGKTLFRIKANISFGNIESGELGGWIEKESNLDQSGNAWVFGEAQVFGEAHVSGNARVSGEAQVFGKAHVFGEAWVLGEAQVFGKAQVFGNAWVLGNAHVFGEAHVFGNAWVFGEAQVFGEAWVLGEAHVFGNAQWITIGPIGSENGFLTAFRQKDNSIMIHRGCFSGTIDDFESAVSKRHGDNLDGQIYMALIPIIKMRLVDVK